jgi:hypothetical protein
MTKARNTQISITLGALGIGLLHLLSPTLTIDAITVALITIAILPWLAPLFKSIEFPGGLKVQFQDLEQAKQAAESAGLLAKPSADTIAHKQLQAPEGYSLEMPQTLDSTLALTALRIEMEKRLRALARKHGIESTRYGINWLLATLRLRGVLNQAEEFALERLAELLNTAVHATEIDPRAAIWAAQVGPALLEALDHKLA